MTVFVDTSAVYAVVNRQETSHLPAMAAWRRLLDEGALLITSNYVVVETIALLHHRLGVEAVRDFQEDIAPLLHIEWIDEARHRSSVAALLAAGRRKLSLVDCVSFQVMREAGVRTAFCFDDHFREQGFDVLP